MKIKPALLFVSFLISVTMTSRADHITVTGSVSGEWSADTVKVAGDLLLEEGNSLLIHPGVLVEFQRSYSFYIGGSLLASGTEGSPVIFDVADTTGFGTDSIPDGGWNGIQFYYTAPSVDSSVFEHCIFRHGKAVGLDTLENHGGAICVRSYNKIRISNCLFEENFAGLNGGALYMEQGSIFLTGNEFVNNSCGPAVFPWGYGGAICSDDSDPYITGNVFTANSSTGMGGAVAIRFRECRVHNNVFSGNYSALGGALGYLHYYEYPHSQCNNLIYDNAAAFFGGGIACVDAGPTLVNNTITENTSAYGGGFYVKDSIVPQLFNCILWNNSAAVGPEVYLWDAYASADFYHCDVQGGPDLFGGSGGGAGYSGNYQHNLDLPPDFEMTADHNYHLSFSSLLINEGTPDTSGLHLPCYDLDGLYRIDLQSQRIDMGCYELQWVGTNENSTGHGAKGIEVFPNPFRDDATILCSDCSVGVLEAEIFDLTGRSMVQLTPVDLNVKSSFTWDGKDRHGKDLPAGIYLVIVRNGKAIQGTARIVKF